MNIRGFTVIELIIIVAFIAILITIATGAGCVSPRYKCVDGLTYEFKPHLRLELVYDTSGKPKTCRM
jgi:hypothetical protein